MQVAFYLAGEITQVLDAIPWVRCASGNVFLQKPTTPVFPLIAAVRWNTAALNFIPPSSVSQTNHSSVFVFEFSLPAATQNHLGNELWFLGNKQNTTFELHNSHSGWLLRGSCNKCSILKNTCDLMSRLRGEVFVWSKNLDLYISSRISSQGEESEISLKQLKIRFKHTMRVKWRKPSPSKRIFLTKGRHKLFISGTHW